MVQETCGWTVRFADDLAETPVPTDLELTTLRDLNERTRLAHAGGKAA
jgi:glutaconate CoA-transferase subunit B